MIVFVTTGTDSRRHYHAHPGCWRLTAGLRRHNSTRVVPLRVNEMKPALRPCQRCYPDIVVEYYQPWCKLCGTYRACPHNGGTLVKTRNGNHWVWPDRVGLHSPLRDP